MSKKELLAKLKLLEPKDKAQRNELVCTLIGHSKICTTFFGYRYCGRCEAQLGDNLGSIDFGAKKAVIVGHSCEVCQANYKLCTWKDKLYVANPFKETTPQ